MTTFFVNGKEIKTEKNQALLRFLRDELHLTSVKDGCSEGACGACTVLIDGEPVRSCTVKTGELDGKHLLTVEGLSAFEKEAFTYAFGEAGAVQCGFCIPGMVLAAKALLDQNSDPDESAIRRALRFNLCRCTGYVKIVKGIRLAADILKEGIIPAAEKNWKVGSRVHRVDVKEKVTGTGIYPDDIYEENMLHVVAVRSKYPRARVLAIHCEKALELAGVERVITAKDIPGVNKVGHLNRDWDTLIAEGSVTHFRGDAVCLVAAESRETALRAAALVQVDYEELPAVFDPYAAMAEGAPIVHPNLSPDTNLFSQKHVSRGNAEEAIAGSEHIFHGTYRTPWTEHAFMEPECAFARPDGDGVLIISADQGVYDTQRETAPMLGLSYEKVKVRNALVGGGFGGKEDVSVQHHCALAAYLTGRPCKMKLSREESLQLHPKRHPMDMEFTMGLDDSGMIQGVKVKVIADAGSYASLSGPVLERACTHASGPYHYQNFEVEGYAYYTNNPPAGAFRGFGVTQTCFGIESLLNQAADELGMSHWEIRYRNAIRPGEELPNGQIVDDSTGLVETLEAVKDVYETHPTAGIACAMKNAGVGVGIPDYGRVRLIITHGIVVIHCGGSCIGQGVGTVLKQMVCDVCGLEDHEVLYEASNTYDAPDSGTTSGSRHTTISGEAARRAAEALNEARKGRGLLEMEGEEFFAEYLAETDPLGADLPHPVSHVAYGYATQVCILDPQSGKISEIIAAHDVGRAVNPTSVEGQIEGGVVMGMGFALRERFPLEKGKPMVKMGSLGLFRSDELPKITAVVVEKSGLNVSKGAIGIGEITCIPTAPAIADAYRRFDGMRRNELPISETPYSWYSSRRPLTAALNRSGKRLNVRKDSRCIGCLECVRACARAYYMTDDRGLACLRIEKRSGDPLPQVCIQCGICAKVCPTGAITQNASGVWMINKKLCDGCGLCRAACPKKVMVDDWSRMKTSKCVACGLCVKACPMDVLEIAKGE